MQGNVSTGCLFFVVPRQGKGRRHQRCNTKTRDTTERTEAFIYLFTLLKEISRESHIPLSLAKIFKEDLYIMDTLMHNKAPFTQHTEHSQE